MKIAKTYDDLYRRINEWREATGVLSATTNIIKDVGSITWYFKIPMDEIDIEFINKIGKEFDVKVKINPIKDVDKKNILKVKFWW